VQSLKLGIITRFIKKLYIHLGEMMRTLTQPNDISDNLNDRISSYQAPASNYQGALGLGQIYQRNGLGMSGIPNMIDGQGYARSRMPYPSRRYWLNARRRYYDGEDDEDEDEEDDGDDSDEDEDEDEEEGRARSYVNRHHFYDDDDDDNEDEADGNGEEIEYSRRFDRKDKIAKVSKKSKKESPKQST
jgi:hypothetical protein